MRTQEPPRLKRMVSIAHFDDDHYLVRDDRYDPTTGKRTAALSYRARADDPHLSRLTTNYQLNGWVPATLLCSPETRSLIIIEQGSTPPLRVHFYRSRADQAWADHAWTRHVQEPVDIINRLSLLLNV